MTKKISKKVAILGGTFDPIHKQHIKAAQLAYKELNLDEVWILPTKKNPLKDNIVASNEQRITMIELTIKNIPYLVLNQYELNSKQEVNYTYETMTYFSKKYPEYQFYFLIGSDNLLQLPKWKNIDQLVKIVTFVVVNRYHYKLALELINYYHCISLTIFPSCDLSSTKVRNGKNQTMINKNVLAYINNNMIYYQQRLLNNMSSARYDHCINVGKTSYELALHHGVNPQEALIAGTYHDIAKEWPENKLKRYLLRYNKKILTLHPNVYHSYAGAAYLKYDLKFKNQKIIDAVKYHTTGALELTKLELIVLLADKISNDRRGSYIDELRLLAFIDLETAFIFYLKILKSSLASRNYQINEDFEKVYQKWVKN